MARSSDELIRRAEELKKKKSGSGSKSGADSIYERVGNAAQLKLWGNGGSTKKSSSSDIYKRAGNAAQKKLWGDDGNAQPEEDGISGYVSGRRGNGVNQSQTTNSRSSNTLLQRATDLKNSQSKGNASATPNNIDRFGTADRFGDRRGAYGDAADKYTRNPVSGSISTDNAEYLRKMREYIRGVEDADTPIDYSWNYTMDPEYSGSSREEQDRYNALNAQRRVYMQNKALDPSREGTYLSDADRAELIEMYDQRYAETGDEVWKQTADRLRNGEDFRLADIYDGAPATAETSFVGDPWLNRNARLMRQSAREIEKRQKTESTERLDEAYFRRNEKKWAAAAADMEASGWDGYNEGNWAFERSNQNPHSGFFGRMDDILGGEHLDEYWTYEEKKLYNWLIAEGRQEDAEEYAKYLSYAAYERRENKYVDYMSHEPEMIDPVEQAKAAAAFNGTEYKPPESTEPYIRPSEDRPNANFLVRTGMALTASLPKLINTLDIIGQKLWNEDFAGTDYSPISHRRSNLYGQMSNAGRDVVVGQLNDIGTVNSLLSNIFGIEVDLGEFGEQGLGSVWSTGVDLVNAYINSTLFPIPGGSLAAMAAESGSDAYAQAIDQGAPTELAFDFMLPYGGAEAAGEMLPFEIFTKILGGAGKSSGWKTALLFGLDLLSDGTGEMATAWMQQAAEDAMLGEYSQYAIRTDNYTASLIDEGYEPGVARQMAEEQVSDEMTNERWESFWAGVLGAGVNTSIATPIAAGVNRYARNSATGNAIREQGNEGTIADWYANATGKEVKTPRTDAGVGRLYYKFVEQAGKNADAAVRREDVNAMLDYYKGKTGSEGGNTPNADQLKAVRNALERVARGKKLTGKQSKTVGKDAAVQATIEAYGNKEIESDRTGSETIKRRAALAPMLTAIGANASTARTPMGETTDDTRRRAEAVGSTMTVTEDAGSSVGGEEIQKVNGIKTVANGAQEATVTVTMADGSSRDVKISEVSFGSDVDANVYEYAAVMATPELANQFRYAARETNMPLDKLANSMNHAYDMGVAGYRNLATVQASSLVKPLNDVRADLVQTAFEIGVRDRGNTVAGRIEQAGKRIAEFSGREWRAGRVITTGIDMSSLKPIQRENIRQTEFVAQLMGINVELFESKANVAGVFEAENGSYNAATNTMRLDINAGRNEAGDHTLAQTAMLRTMSHELTHAIQRNSPELYEQLKNAVLDVLEAADGYDLNTRVDKRLADAQAAAEKLGGKPAITTKEQAIDEIIADACEMMLSGSDAIKRLADAHPDVAKSFGEKVIDFIDRLLAAVRKLFGKENNAESRALAKALEADLQNIREMWSKALVETSEVSGRENVGGSAENAVKNAEAATENATNAAENSETVGMYDESAQPAEAHIDQRTWAEVGDRKVNAFLNDYKYARIYMPSAASVLAADLQNSTKGERFMTTDGEWNGQKRMTTGIIADALNNGMTWDGLQNAVQTIMNVMNEAGQDGEMRCNAAIKRVELMLDDMLSNGYKDSYGNTFAPDAEYIAYKNSLPGAVAQATPKAAEGSMEFGAVQFQVRDNAEIKPTEADIEVLRKIGRKSINEFTSAEIRDTEVWARKFYRELGTKSPYFRRWFGDWRQYSNTKVNLTPVSTISMDEALKSMEYGEFSNGDTEWKIMAGSLGKNDTRSKANGPKISVKMLSEIRGIISNSILLDTEVSLKNSGKKHNDTTFMHKLYAPVMYEGSMYAAKVTVEEYGFGDETGRRFYNLKAIKISPAVGAPIAKTTYGTITLTGDTLTIADFFDVVKRNDPEFKPHPVSKNMLNEDGTPKLMYHGTPYGGYTVFKDWQYFTEDKKYADVYQEPSASSIRGRYNPATNPMTYAAYLSVKKPFDTRDPKMRRIWQDEFYGSYSRTPLSDKGLPDWTDGIDLVEWIEENDYDYDAIILDEGGTGGYGDDVNSRGISVVVRNSAQIKSATDNVGTFDPNNPDIRYSTRATEDDVASMSIKQLDAGYMDAVKSGDEQQMMVYLDEMAYRNGYKSATLMHGTRKFGFTKFAAENGFIFMSDTLRMAQSYAGGRLGERRIHESREDVRERLKKLSPEAFMESYKELTGYELTQSYDDFAKHYEYMVGRKPRKKQGAIYYDKQTLEQYTLDDAVAYLTEYRGGIYELYANLDNFYEVDANFESWKEISGKWIGKRKGTYVKTDDVAEWAKAHGYNGVIIRNVDDMGNLMMPVGDEGQYTDVYIAFDPTLVKSADPVTYDDNGDVIPLSQRFNEAEGDIRYSVRDPEQVSDRAILADVVLSYNFDATDAGGDAERMIQLQAERKKIGEYKAALGKYEELKWRLEEPSKVIAELHAKAEAIRQEYRREYMVDDALANLNAAEKAMATKADRTIALLSGIENLNEHQRHQLDAARETVRKLAQKTGMTDEQYAEWRRAKEKSEEYTDRGLLPKEDRKRLTEAEEKIRTVSKEIAQMDAALLEMESSEALRGLIGRERERIREEAQKRVERVKQGYANKVTRDRLKKKAARLDDMLRHPKDGDYIPDDLRSATLDFLSMLYDKTGGSALDWRSETEINKRKKKERENTRRIDRILREYQAIEHASERLSELYEEEIVIDLTELRNTVGAKDFGYFNREELQIVGKIIDHISFLANAEMDAFVEGRKQRMDDLAAQTGAHMFGRDNRKNNRGMRLLLNKAVAQEMTPAVFFRSLGGPFKKLAQDLLDAESEYGIAVGRANAKVQEISRKHNREKWDPNATMEIVLENGGRMILNTEEALTLYAVHKREKTNTRQDARHLEVGGVVEQHRNKKLQKMSDGSESGKKVTVEDMREITRWLGAEKIAYADEMIAFMSGELARRLNAASRKLSGYSKFEEEFYFPYQVSAIHRASGAVEAENVLLKNWGSAKRTTPNANKPIVLSEFTNTVTEHIEAAYKYAIIAVPQDNMHRLLNYRFDESNTMHSRMNEAYGAHVYDYINTWIKDIYGTKTPTNNILTQAASKLTSAMKRNAVVYSASVWTQQYSAIYRAWAEIGPQYFYGKVHNPLASWEQAKKYAGTVAIKEIGRFDTNIGHNVAEWIEGKPPENLRDKIFDKTSFMPEVMDKLGWVRIWEACKREQAKETGLDINSEELLQRAGRRMDEIVRLTQVYDSVFSKNEYMRSKNPLAKMLTNFGAEPAITVNMWLDAWSQRKVNPQKLLRVAAALVVSSIQKNLLLSLVRAIRDDDDEEDTFWEKYIYHFTGGMTGDLNPFEYLPFLSDIWGTVQGFTTERDDMSVISDGVAYIKTMFNEDKPWQERSWAAAELLGLATGIPVKNIHRDIGGLFRQVFIDGKRSWREGAFTNAVKYGWAENSVLGNMLGMEDTRSYNIECMYEAVIAGDSETAEEYRKHILLYNDPKKTGEKKLNSDFKSRVKEGYLDGDMTDEEAVAMLETYAGMKHDDAVAYVDKLRYTADNDGADYSDLHEAYVNGDMTAEEAQTAQVDYGGKKPEDAASATAKWDFERETGIPYDNMKDAYLNGEITKKDAVAARVKYGGMEQGDAEGDVAKWDFEKDYGYDYNDMDEHYLAGDISQSKAIDARVKYGGQERDDAYFTVISWDYEKTTGKEWHGKFTKVHDGIDAGNLAATRGAIDEIYKHGGYEDTDKAYAAVNSSITSTYKPLYIAATPAERKRMENRLVMAYEYNAKKAGKKYDPDRKLKDIRKWTEED